MHIRAGYDISLITDRPTPMAALLSVHPSRNKDLRTPQRIVAQPDVPIYDYVDGFGNVCTRLTIPVGTTTLSSDFVIADSGDVDRSATGQLQVPVPELPDEILVYLLGSRYCETDRLSTSAWALFGGIQPGWKLVEAIVDYTHNHISFGYEHARATRTAWEAHEERFGVCRDYAHLAIALCRSMNIPARYCTGFLGDIGVPVVGVMDFSAWFDVYLGGEWYTFDARNRIPRIGRILMARGRDATDAALTTTFGPAILARFDVHTYEVDENLVAESVT
jgi:transglutaminase-like putative cysteine protease